MAEAKQKTAKVVDEYAETAPVEEKEKETPEKTEVKEKAVTEAKEEVKAEAKDKKSEESEKPKEAVAEQKPTEGKKPFERERGRKGRYPRRRFEKTREEIIEEWKPQTRLGILVKTKKITDLDEILDKNMKILEPEIVDALIDVKTDLIAIGQSKGKFGGGKRRAWRQTQRKKKEGSVPTFSAMAVVGDGKGHVGVGVGKSTETLPARDKAIRKAKLNILRVIRGDGSFDSVGGGDGSIPYKIEGKSGSVRVILMPAAPGTGLVVADELKKILKMAGIKDVYSKASGRLRTTFNLIKACMDALEKTNPRKQIE